MLIKTIFTDYFFFLRDEKKKQLSEIKMSFSTQSKNKLKDQITLYSDFQKKNRWGGVWDAIHFKFSIAIFGPTCGRAHDVALKIPVSL